MFLCYFVGGVGETALEVLTKVAMSCYTCSSIATNSDCNSPGDELCVNSEQVGKQLGNSKSSALLCQLENESFFTTGTNHSLQPVF